MGLTEHAGLKALDSRLSAIMHKNKVGKKYGYKEADALRGAFRTAASKLATERQSFRSERNGRGTFAAWLSGHIFAERHRADDTAYIHFSAVSDALFFIGPECLGKLDSMVAKYTEKVKVLEDTLSVGEIMMS